MAVSTDASYNSNSRTIYHKVDIYLNGTGATPLSVTRDDYIATTSLLEEATSGDTPFDNVSSNEFTLNLYNSDNKFTPTNTSSPYYGKMKRGVMVIPYFRTSESDDWSPVGKFYVTDWVASPTSSTAAVTADDTLYNIFGQDAQDMAVTEDTAVSAFYTTFFAFFGVVPVIDSALTETLVMAFNELENKAFLSALSTAFLCICNCAHNGSVVIKKLTETQILRATITDADQVKTIDVKLSVASDYDSAYLKYYVPQESAEESVLSVNEVDLTTGANTLTYNLDKSPLLRYKSVSFTNEDILVTMTSAICTSMIATLKATVTSDVTTSLNINGIYVEKIGYEIGEQDDNPLSVDNVYIQDTQSAIDYKAIMDTFAAGVTPVLQATIKGNPNFEIGDKIRVISTRYNIDFTGIIMRQQFDYDGGLECVVTLLNAALVEV
jgi:hypothetical protein